MKVELITKKVKINQPFRDRCFSIDGDAVVLIFADLLYEDLVSKVKNILNNNISVVIVTLDTREPISDKKLAIIHVNSHWYIHTLFMDPFIFKAVYGVGEKGKVLANAFSQFTGLKIYKLKDLERIIALKKLISKAILIKTYDGIGDLLMCTPTAKTYYSKGYTVDFLVWPGREVVLQNLPYINRIYTNPKEFSLLFYKRFYDISFKLSNYSNLVCRQHRIYATANMCGLKNDELVISKPEIILTEDEIKKGETLLKGVKSPKLLITFESFDVRRSYPDRMQQPLIDYLSKSFNVVITGYNRKAYNNCLNLTGQLDIRTFFSVAYSSDLVLTVDTSTLHIAAAFNKPTVFLPSTIYHKWRAYDNVVSLIPKVSCYCCNEAIDANKAECIKTNNQNCLHTVRFNSILSALFKVFNNGRNLNGR